MTPICPNCSNIVLMVAMYRARCFKCKREYQVQFKDIYSPKRKRIYRLEEIAPRVDPPQRQAPAAQDRRIIYEEYEEPPPVHRRREPRRPSWQDDLRM